MENIDKGLTVPKWLLINRPKMPQMPQNLSAQGHKFGISIKQRVHRTSEVPEKFIQTLKAQNNFDTW